MKITKITFQLFKPKDRNGQCCFLQTDTITGTTAYHFTVDRMRLRVKALLPIVFRNHC